MKKGYTTIGFIFIAIFLLLTILPVDFENILSDEDFFQVAESQPSRCTCSTGGGGGGGNGNDNDDPPPNDNGNDNDDPPSNDNDEPDPPECNPSDECDADCSGVDCGVVSGTRTIIDYDCNVETESCSVDCGECPSTETFCQGDKIKERSYSCQSNVCVSSTITIEDCSDNDGWDCADDDTKIYREHTCSESSCIVSEESEYSCSQEYGDRSFCSDGDCESNPEAQNLSWNIEDHNFEEFKLNRSGNYWYCGANNPPDVILSWEYSSQTGDNHEKSKIEVSKDGDFGATLEEGEVTSDNLEFTVSGRELSFDTDYYWRVKVVDENNNTSEWFKSDFSTDEKRANTEFSWSPEKVVMGEIVEFEDVTEYENIKERNWFFEGADPKEAEGKIVETIFEKEAESRNVRLEITDQDNVVCFSERKVDLEVPFPDWREIIPWGVIERNLSVLKSIIGFIGTT